MTCYYPRDLTILGQPYFDRHVLIFLIFRLKRSFLVVLFKYLGVLGSFFFRFVVIAFIFSELRKGKGGRGKGVRPPDGRRDQKSQP